MNNLERHGGISRASLDKGRYFESLLTVASDAGVLSPRDAEKIQLDTFALLAERTARFTGGESSSVKREVAEEILSSVTFTTSLYLKSFPSPDDALAALLSDGVKNSYLRGHRICGILVGQAKLLHGLLLKKIFVTENEFFNSTLRGGIAGFFKLYDADFSAREIHITADYPTFIPVENLGGIEFIKEYLENLLCENALLTAFDSEEVNALLAVYDGDYAHQLFNLYSPVLASSLGSIAAGGDDLEITDATFEKLRDIFGNADESGALRILQKSADVLLNVIPLSASSAAYLKNCLPTLAKSVASAAKRDALASVFPHGDGRKAPAVSIAPGARADDAHYRELLAEFSRLTTAEERSDFIQSKLYSLEDTEDILIDSALAPSDIADIFARFPPPEISVLIKKYTYGGNTDDNDANTRDFPVVRGLVLYLSSLPDERREFLITSAGYFE